MVPPSLRWLGVKGRETDAIYQLMLIQTSSVEGPVDLGLNLANPSFVIFLWFEGEEESQISNNVDWSLTTQSSIVVYYFQILCIKTKYIILK